MENERLVTMIPFDANAAIRDQIGTALAASRNGKVGITVQTAVAAIAAITELESKLEVYVALHLDHSTQQGTSDERG